MHRYGIYPKILSDVNVHVESIYLPPDFLPKMVNIIACEGITHIHTTTSNEVIIMNNCIALMSAVVMSALSAFG